MSASNSKTSFAEQILAWRDRLFARPAFQRFATAFPLTRGIAKRRARALFDLCAGFVYSQILLACVQLRLFDLLRDGPRTIEQLAAPLALPESSARVLLEAAAAIALVERRRGGRFGLGPLGLALVGNPGLKAMIEHHAILYADLADPVALLRGERDTALSRFWPYAVAGQPAALAPETVAAYSRLMASSQSFIAREVLDAYRFDRHRCLLDVGGGEGAFLCAAAARFPQLRLMLFDLPAVAERARARFSAEGIAARAAAFGGDFKTDPLPEGADIISLVRVLHDHDDDAALAILKAARRALPAGGTVLIAEPMAGARGEEPGAAAYFGIYLLAMGSGRPRKPEEVCALLEQAGFAGPRRVATRNALLVSIISAQAAADGALC